MSRINKLYPGSQVREISVEFVVEVSDRTALRRPKMKVGIGTSLSGGALVPPI